MWTKYPWRWLPSTPGYPSDKQRPMFPGPPWGRASWDSVPPLLPAAVGDLPRSASHSGALDGCPCAVLLMLAPRDPRAWEAVARCLPLSAAAPRWCRGPLRSPRAGRLSRCMTVAPMSERPHLAARLCPSSSVGHVTVICLVQLEPRSRSCVAFTPPRDPSHPPPRSHSGYQLAVSRWGAGGQSGAASTEPAFSPSRLTPPALAPLSPPHCRTWRRCLWTTARQRWCVSRHWDLGGETTGLAPRGQMQTAFLQRLCLEPCWCGN